MPGAKPFPILNLEHPEIVPEPNSGCWLWTGCLHSQGYGKFKRRGRDFKAHRVSYEQHCGPIPNGMCVLHKCDVRACVNPDHLYAGTRRDNNRDTAIRGRNGNAKLSIAQVTEMRQLRKQGIMYKNIAALYGVSKNGAFEIIKGQKTRRYV